MAGMRRGRKLLSLLMIVSLLVSTMSQFVWAYDFGWLESADLDLGELAALVTEEAREEDFAALSWDDLLSYMFYM